MLAAATSPALADDAARPSRTVPGVLALLPPDVTTEHTLTVGGQTLRYTATMGTLPLYDQGGERSASIVYTAYTLKDADAAARPITFLFNGGPGASSAYLHIGAVGPQTVDLGPGREAAGAQLRDNPASWLGFTDLVAIDPVGTGWSRAAKSDKAGDFWGADVDAGSIAKTIALYVANNARGASPKYLLGESYGGFRAIKVGRALAREQGLPVDGIVMLSPFLEGPLQFGASRFALGAALHFPPLAAAELDRTGRFTPEALAAAERFALGEYLTSLAARPPEGEAARGFYARVAALSGLPVETVARGRGFVRDAYVKQTAADRAAVVSPYDATQSAPDPYPESESAEGPDFVLDGYTQALGGLFVGYARDRLGFKTPMTYNLLNREISGRWDWGRGGRAQASVTRDMRELLALNPRLRMLIAHGRSDVVTPYSISRYVLDHLPPIGGPDRTALKLYKGGHMFYFDPHERAAFAADAAAFYRAAGL